MAPLAATIVLKVLGSSLIGLSISGPTHKWISEGSCGQRCGGLAEQEIPGKASGPEMEIICTLMLLAKCAFRHYYGTNACAMNFLISAECKIWPQIVALKTNSWRVCVCVLALFQWKPILLFFFWFLIPPVTIPLILASSWASHSVPSLSNQMPGSFTKQFSAKKMFKGQRIRDTADVRLWQSQQRIPHLYAAQKDIPGVLCKENNRA